MQYDIQIGYYDFISIPYQLYSITFYYFFAIILNMYCNIRCDVISRITSSINAFIVSYYSLLLTLGYTDTETFINVYALMIGYMINDIFFMFKGLNYNINKALPFLIHHFVVIFSQLSIRDYTYTYAVASLSEIPTIFLNISWLLMKYNYKGLALKYTGYTLAITYFITRPLIFTGLNIYFYIIKFTNVISIILPMLTILNYYWFYKLYRKIRIELSYMNKVY